MRLRLLLACDRTLVEAGVLKLLESRFELVGTTGRAGTAAAGRLKPDLILLDIAMPLGDGLTLARQMAAASQAAVAFAAVRDGGASESLAYHTAGSACLLKPFQGVDLPASLNKVLKDRTGAAGLGSGELTGRERSVLELVAKGHPAKEIAALLAVSVQTVAFHKANLARKLGIHSTAGMTRYAIRHGIIEP